MSSYHGWHVFWLAWFLAWFGTFLGAEIYGLVTDWHRTLSAAIWSLEREHTGEPIWQWSALHVLFIGFLVVIFVWLLVHFAFAIWR